MSFEHYDLNEKWNKAGALVCGVPARIRTAELSFVYDGHYESEDLDYSISIWPIGDEEGSTVPCLFGSGDLYFRLVDGFNRDSKLAPYAPAALAEEQWDWFTDFFHDFVQLEAGATPTWYLVGPNVSLFYGVMLKPGKVPNPVPDGLEVVRGRRPGDKPHPRAIVGVHLCGTRAATHVAFDPGDPVVKAAKKAITAAFPISVAKAQGFVIIPTPTSDKISEVPKTSETASPEEALPDPWRQRLEDAFGPLEEGIHGELISAGATVRIYRLEEEPEDALEAWAAAPVFEFTDHAADVTAWRAGGATLLDVVVTRDEDLYVERRLALTPREGGHTLIVARGVPLAHLKRVLEIPDDVPPKRWKTTLGHG